MNTMHAAHLTPDEVVLWAEGLLPAARALHLSDCPDCLATAERERALFLQLARLERPAPSAGFADRVMGKVRIPTPSGGFKATE
jgi:hypothetical protein